jgi:hypothetical protein
MNFYAWGLVIKKVIMAKKALFTQSLLADVGPQLLGDMRERSNVPDIGDTPSNGTELLEDMKERLSLEGRELQRMEDEGGLPLNSEQRAKVSECLKASQRIKTVLRASNRIVRAKKLK